ncbi:MAG TPA: glycosyltransferase [Pararhodobacter sp.]|uniref:glycosyltransferase family 2 protein n=1 Tax=Pararhodobacter sp. TaxID=2127056 RepID=UPI002BA5B21E|nr:glycosyltransferase [Pararhodobacter sp.]HPD91495.1 glycosyltransferase [Pararhodobacter sp.]
MTLSVILPACNEGAYIDACLAALLASDGPAVAQVVVAANGCTDDTVARARGHDGAFAARGWALTVLDLPALGKPGALNAGDAAAVYPLRAYLDADVQVSPPLMAQIAAALAVPGARYVSGTPVVTARSWVSRAYARFWVRLPFVAQGVPGFGLFAVNAAGRARWDAFPAIISDDTYVRIQFAPDERVKLPAPYHWPLVEGFARLVRVRRRQDQGVVELTALAPDLMANEGKDSPSRGWLLRRLVADPPAFAVYTAVKLAVRLGGRDQSGWVRGR